MSALDRIPPGAGPTPLEWSALRFHPLGLFDLRRRLAKPIEESTFQRFRTSFEAAEIGWFAAGLASSPCDIGPSELFPELHELRQNTVENGTEIRKALRKRVRNVTFDCASLLDRAFGSTTLVIHIPGTTRPGSLLREDYVKADVYFPGHLIREDIHFPKAVSQIVQTFIKDIGLPTVSRYSHCARLHWTLPEATGTQAPYSQQRTYPVAKPPRSSVFEHNGRTPTRPVVVVVDDDDDNDDSFDNQHSLKNELVVVYQQLQEAQQALNDARRRENELLGEIDRLCSAVRHNPSSVPRSVPHTPERTRPMNLHNSTLDTSGMVTPSGVVTSGTAGSPSRQGGRSRSDLSSVAIDSAWVASSPKAIGVLSSYAKFIKSNNLERKFSQIERIRSNVALYMWPIELARTGIPEDLVDGLIALMKSQPSQGD